jgi:hypothetical protein
VQEQPVDTEQRGVLAKIGDDVVVPYFLEESERLRHIHPPYRLIHRSSDRR